MKDLIICVPSTGKVNVQLVPKLAQWANKGAELAFITVPFIDNARNVACRHLLSSKKKVLLFVDSDVIPEENAPEKLLKANKDIVGGWYNLTLGPTPAGTVEIRPSAFTSIIPDRPLYLSTPIIKDTGIQKVEILSGGLLMIKREVIEKIADPRFEIKWLEDEHISFEGEDIGFCRKARNAGFELWCDTSVYAPHSKEILI